MSHHLNPLGLFNEWGCPWDEIADPDIPFSAYREMGIADADLAQARHDLQLFLVYHWYRVPPREETP